MKAEKFFIIVALKILLLGGCTHTQINESKETDNEKLKPNILLIQVDDFGYDDLGIHGNEIIQTPSLDELANQSVQFNNFYVSSLCAPSRASLLTGRNFMKTGVSGVHGGRDYIDLSETLLPQKLQKNGYITGMWGKWHSGKTNGYFPWDRGFDEAYYASLYNYFDNVGLLNGSEIKTQGSATKVITDFAINFIEENKSKPFFAYVPYMAPHNPWRAPESIIEKYQKKGLSRAMSSLYAMIDNLDQNIGRLLESLERAKVSDNTIVIFVSDNGPWVKSYRFGLSEDEWALRNPNNKKGMKGDNWENGIHSPLFIRWPKNYAAKTTEQLSQIEDLYPTILTWAGIEFDSEKLDGSSLVNVLNGGELSERYIVSAYASPSTQKVNYHELDPTGFYYPLSSDYRIDISDASEQRLAVRHGDFKLVQNEGNQDKVVLYNLAKDPLETTNVFAEHKGIAKEMQEYLTKWYEKVLDEPNSLKMPTFQIGYKNRKLSQIYASSPSDISADLMNTNHFLANWTNEGAWAKYNVNVNSSGTYQARLITNMQEPSSRVFTLSCGESALSSSLEASDTTNEFGTLIQNESAYWSDFDKPETFKAEIHNFILGDIKLDATCSVLKLELVEVKPNTTVAELDQVIAIQLIKH
ncbi:Arylsulfatase [Pseudoalteromonas sp. P1-30]|uniref:sulfatase-like hydrolase/transferase n=1 Tax=unclassified Pseudoalteromonas TaxID=194690 RepID=UPI0006D5DD31|nr:sulfatase-like hydrolase/transferase [Pseudoalteromonas sp. P1-30]KPV90063.1 Arylsulfatase [Pseudoalteromonas sp. P1-30]|tara:strand:- start:9568 stop:11484 length:1917 start_codon:yes stop_codon:yes gene_type:complete